MKSVVSTGANQVTPGGNDLCSRAISTFTAFITVSALALGSTWMPKAATGRAVDVRAEGVVVRSESDLGDVTEPDRSAVGIGAQQDVPELVDGAELPLGRDGGGGLLAPNRRRGADRAGGDLDVLALHGIQRRGRGQAVGVQLVRIQPDPHRVIGAEQVRGADTVDALDGVQHVGGDEMVELRGIRAAGTGAQRDHGQEAGARLVDLQALLIHFCGQERLRQRGAVLRLHFGYVGVGAGGEGQGDLRLAEARLGGEVEKVVDAGELLLDHLRDGGFHRARVRAGVAGIDLDLRRRDIGIRVTRQPRQGDSTQQHDEQGDDPGEDRPVDEELRHAQRLPGCVGGGQAMRCCRWRYCRGGGLGFRVRRRLLDGGDL